MQEGSVVQRLARFVVARSWDDLSPAAREDLKIRVLDSLGCALGALDAQPVSALRGQVSRRKVFWFQWAPRLLVSSRFPGPRPTRRRRTTAAEAGKSRMRRNAA